MPFLIRPFRPLPLNSCVGLWFLITLLVLSSGPAYAEWVRALNHQTDPTLYVDSNTIRRNGTVVRWWIHKPQTMYALSLRIRAEDVIAKAATL